MDQILANTNDLAERSQKAALFLEAPVEMVWEIWTKPDHIKHWWGPSGFTNTIEKMEVRPGGEWLFVMHGPDGRNFPNRTVFREVIPCRKLVHQHFEPNFIAVIEFETLGETTFLSWHKAYETKALFEMVETDNRASEGFRQTIERMKAYLSQLK